MEGDIGALLFVGALVFVSIIITGIFTYNVFASLGMKVTKCKKGYHCTSGNILASSGVNCKDKCVTSGIYGGLAHGCCTEGEGEQKMALGSILTVIFGFLIIIGAVGFGVLYLNA